MEGELEGKPSKLCYNSAVFAWEAVPAAGKKGFYSPAPHGLCSLPALLLEHLHVNHLINKNF